MAVHVCIHPCSGKASVVVARLMQENGLGVCRRRRYRVTTESKHNLPIAEDLLSRQFEVGTPNRA